MNTLDIDTKVDLPNFLGAFAYNEIPNIPNDDFSLVINTDDSESPGDHWIPILRKKELFISLIPLVEVIKVLYLKKNFRKLYQKSLAMGNGDLIISYCRIYFEQLVYIMHVILF